MKRVEHLHHMLKHQNWDKRVTAKQSNTLAQENQQLKIKSDKCYIPMTSGHGGSSTLVRWKQKVTTQKVTTQKVTTHNRVNFSSYPLCPPRYTKPEKPVAPQEQVSNLQETCGKIIHLLCTSDYGKLTQDELNRKCRYSEERLAQGLKQLELEKVIEFKWGMWVIINHQPICPKCGLKTRVVNSALTPGKIKSICSTCLELKRIQSKLPF
ncbi:MAG: hypothetical protein F6K26_10655 [Moorea sp. SIO2I5]|nr:hypothetical protein [Moorena sp. SIO2I5]